MSEDQERIEYRTKTVINHRKIKKIARRRNQEREKRELKPYLNIKRLESL
jgi:hypothetical protein